MKKVRLILALALCPWLASAGWKAPPDPVMEMVDILLMATKNNDLAQFHSVCDEPMKEAITAEVLRNVHMQVSGLMKTGYQTSYMGVLKRGPYQTYFWRLSFKAEEANDDVLVEMSVMDGKVGGFLLR